MVSSTGGDGGWCFALAGEFGLDGGQVGANGQSGWVSRAWPERGRRPGRGGCVRVRRGVRVLSSGGRPVSGTGDPRAVVLLGHYGVEPRLQVIAGWRDGVPGVEERDGAFELTAVVAQLVSGQGVHRVLGLFYCGSLIWPWSLVLACWLSSGGGGVILLPKLPGR